MIELIKKLIVTDHSIVAIFESDTREDEHISRISLTKKQYYCSCEDFLFNNNIMMMYEGRVYKCKHLTFLEFLLANPQYFIRLVELGKISRQDYVKLIENYRKVIRRYEGEIKNNIKQ